MLEKITTRELLTADEAMRKYSTKYFDMHITEVVDVTGQFDKGYVLYIADDKRELLSVPSYDFHEGHIAYMMGDDVPELYMQGDVEICERFDEI